MPLQQELHFNGKILNLQFLNFFLITFSFKEIDWFSLVLLHMWVTYELIWMNFTAKNGNFMFSEVFPIVNPIVNRIGLHYPKLRAINICF